MKNTVEKYYFCTRGAEGYGDVSPNLSSFYCYNVITFRGIGGYIIHYAMVPCIKPALIVT